jgi:hypothetical protein
MDLRVQGSVPVDPFLGAKGLFETDHDLELPVEVRVGRDPDARTWVGHHEDRHVLNISATAATSAMARELALHEYAHMARHEESHPSHVLQTEEVLFLALAGRRVERRVLHHCYQIANHVKDIYADDITLSVGPPDKLVDFLESELAAALADSPAPVPTRGVGGPGPRPGLEPGRGRRLTPGADATITAVNAAFALALLERHDAVERDHRIYDLAHAAAADAPEIDLSTFKTAFRDLAVDPTESAHRRALLDVVREYVDANGTDADGGAAAD